MCVCVNTDMDTGKYVEYVYTHTTEDAPTDTPTDDNQSPTGGLKKKNKRNSLAYAQRVTFGQICLSQHKSDCFLEGPCWGTGVTAQLY